MDFVFVWLDGGLVCVYCLVLLLCVVVIWLGVVGWLGCVCYWYVVVGVLVVWSWWVGVVVLVICFGFVRIGDSCGSVGLFVFRIICFGLIVLGLFSLGVGCG